jgi:hypothetical protein
MKLYCLVTNNTVTEGPLPLSPVLSTLSDFELLDLGWYYAECIRPESFVDRMEVMNLQFDIQPRKVICTFVKRDKTQEELDAQNTVKQQEVENDKTSRLSYAETFMTSEEFSQLSEEMQSAWNIYVQTVTNTITEGLGDDIWDVGFPSIPIDTESVLP